MQQLQTLELHTSSPEAPAAIPTIPAPEAFPAPAAISEIPVPTESVLV
jgi:hypothetical protein